jgi:hypothetical protein
VQQFASQLVDILICVPGGGVHVPALLLFRNQVSTSPRLLLATLEPLCASQCKLLRFEGLLFGGNDGTFEGRQLQKLATLAASFRI